MKNNLFIFFLALSVNLYSQESTPKDSLWTTKGNVAVLLNQTGFSDWVGGGTNNFSGTIKFDYEWEYTNLGWNWLTNFESAYGLAKFKNAPFARKIDDRVLIQSIIGKEFSKNLSFSAFFNFTSQIGKGYKYKKDSENNEIRELTTQAFSPAYFQIGSGFLWKKSEKLWLNYSPIASRLILVNKRFTENLTDNEKYFGVDKNKGAKYFFGALFDGYFKKEIAKNIIWENKFNFYINYLEETKNIDFDWNANFRFKVNSVVSGTFIIHLLYDDDLLADLQVRELLGLGVNIDL